ncbi:MAG: SAM-dependent chlorinase/fluorinase [Candidatus Hydrogenedentota bacterium]
MITLTTDFGYQDAYAGILKGILLSELPEEKVIDITHDIPPCNYLSGAYVLKTYYRYFPPYTFHLVVVDPGVGSVRRGLIVKTRDQVFIGPDNGVFSYLFRDNADVECFLIDESMYHAASKTFHARDIFVREIIRIKKKGIGDLKKVYDPVSILPAISVDGNLYTGAVIHIDKFGNLITNIEKKDGIFKRCIRIGRKRVNIVFKEIYSYIKQNNPLLLLNSQDHYEIAINRGDAYKRFKANTGTPIILEK